MVAVCWGSIVAHILQPDLLKIAVEAKKSFGNRNIKHPPEDFLLGRHCFIFPHQLFAALGFAHESLDFFGFQFQDLWLIFNSIQRSTRYPEANRSMSQILGSIWIHQVMGKKSSTSRFDQRNNTMCDFALALLGQSRISKRGEFLLQKWISQWQFDTFWPVFGIEVSLKLQSTLWYARLVYHFTHLLRSHRFSRRCH